MTAILNIAIIIGCLSPLITNAFWKERWTESRSSKAYVRKHFGGLRYFIVPAICIYVLLYTDLRTFCMALLISAVLKFALSLFFGTDRKSRISDPVQYLFYLFLGLTWFYNEPVWLQIWPSLWCAFLFCFSLLATLTKNPQWIMSGYASKEGMDPMLQKMSYYSTPLWLLFMCANEYVRRSFSFENWALYNAFYFPVFVFICFICTITFVPWYFNRREAKAENAKKEAGELPHLTLRSRKKNGPE